jgi:phospholipase/lecithinase/hemolysin
MTTALAVLVALLLWHPSSRGGPITVFGDSLSDTGNAFAATGGHFPPSPYSAGRFSNGALWVEQLATKLGTAMPTPSSLGGSNYAFAGATTGDTPLGAQLGIPAGYSPLTTPAGQFIANVPSLPMQVAEYLGSLKGAKIDSGTLFTVWAGANDFFDGQRDPTVVAKNISNVVATLIAAGAKNFLIPNLPDLSKTPYGLSSSSTTQQGLHALTVGFNSALNSDLSLLGSTSGVHIHMLDTFGLFQRIQANPAQYGLSNVTGEGIMSGNSSAPGYLFWDDVHPTAAGHQILADQAYNSVTTPEPASLTLLASGVFALLGYGWRKRKIA